MTIQRLAGCLVVVAALGCAPGPTDRDVVDPRDDGKADGDGAATDELFAATNLPQFDLELSAEAVAALTADPRTYVRGTFRHGATTLSDVGVSLKGNRSFRGLDQKAAFKIKFDQFVDGQTFRGLKRLTLNNAVGDPSFVAERLAYTTFRAAGVPAPRANSAVVTLNGAPYGVYVNVESLDKRFLGRWFDSSSGNLYESEFVDLAPGSAAEFELKTNEQANDRADLIALTEAMAAIPAETMLADLEPYLDMREFLRFCALEAVLNQWDGYAYYGDLRPNNFQLYHDPSTSKFSFLPWGLDATLKPRRLTFGTDHVYVWGVHAWLIDRCTRGASCRAAYVDALREVTDLFESLALDTQAQQMFDQIRDAVLDDPRKEVNGAGFELAFSKVLEIIRAQPAKVRADIAE